MPIDDHTGDPSDESEGPVNSDEFAEPIESYDANESDALWPGDSTTGDVYLIGPEDEFVRPDTTVLVDEYSRTILRYHLGSQGSSDRAM